MGNIISVRGPAKRHGGHEALADIDLKVRRGKIFVLLRPNGLGKATTVEILEASSGGWPDFGVRRPRGWRQPSVSSETRLTQGGRPVSTYSASCSHPARQLATNQTATSQPTHQKGVLFDCWML